MTTHQAKKIIKKALDDACHPYTKLTSRTINFQDLARADCIFVTVHGWKPHPFANELASIAKEHGFRVEFKGVGFVS
jgi:hypothetical protein